MHRLLPRPVQQVWACTKDVSACARQPSRWSLVQLRSMCGRTTVQDAGLCGEHDHACWTIPLFGGHSSMAARNNKFHYGLRNRTPGGLGTPRLNHRVFRQAWLMRAGPRAQMMPSRARSVAVVPSHPVSGADVCELISQALRRTYLDFSGLVAGLEGPRMGSIVNRALTRPTLWC